MSSWSAFEREAPALAAAGRRCLVGADGVALGFLATVSDSGRPRLAPVCPVFSGEHLYLIAVARTPKAGDLRARGAWALHAPLGADDEEFRLSGTAREVEAADERARLHGDVPFAAFDRADPVFRLAPERALHVHWERVGQPDTRPVRARWVAGGGRG